MNNSFCFSILTGKTLLSAIVPINTNYIFMKHQLAWSLWWILIFLLEIWKKCFMIFITRQVCFWIARCYFYFFALLLSGLWSFYGIVSFYSMVNLSRRAGGKEERKGGIWHAYLNTDTNCLVSLFCNILLLWSLV